MMGHSPVPQNKEDFGSSNEEEVQETPDKVAESGKQSLMGTQELKLSKATSRLTSRRSSFELRMLPGVPMEDVQLPKTTPKNSSQKIEF